MKDTFGYVLSPESQEALHIARALAKEYQHGTFSPPHLLKALMHENAGLLPLLQRLEKDIYYIEEWAEVRMESLSKTHTTADPVPGDDLIDCVLLEADTLRTKFSLDEVDAACLLATLVTPGVGFSRAQLKSLPLTAQEITDATAQPVLTGGAPALGTSGTASGHATALHKYGVNKLEQARAGQLDNIVGRDREIRMMTEILSRRAKPNVIIVGEPGVGKTALVEGFALKLADNNVPASLQNAQLFELDTGALAAGASYRGEMEDRLKSVLTELKAFDRAILFIDEIHTLMDKSGSHAGVVNILKPELARGELTVIGATTHDEYRKHIESDEAFKRRFETLGVEPPDDTTAVMMLKGVLPYYEAHHGMTLEEPAIKEAVRLARRYLKERQLPDAALDLVDRTLAAAKNMEENAAAEITALEQELFQLSAQPETTLEQAQWFYKTLQDRTSYLLMSHVEEQDKPTTELVADWLTYQQTLLTQLKEALAVHRPAVTSADLAATVAYSTGIPMGKIQSQERERLMNMEEHLKARVVGQDHTLSTITEAILESRSGLTKATQPIGSFFFLGPTGTGKTELAKALAEFLFQTEAALIRFDMSEFKEEHSAALLYGAPPGYVGYEEGGMLVNKIRQQPYAVVLFDEIEKAHRSVFDIFLQMLDEGKLHDRLGKVGDFSNAVILFTSNIGSDYIREAFADDQIPTATNLMEAMSRHFRPEFLGRLSGVVPFAPISEPTIIKIFERQLDELRQMLGKQQITLEVTEPAQAYLATLGFNPTYGARPLRGVIRQHIRSPLSRMIVSGKLQKGDHVVLAMDEQQQLVWK